MYVCGMKSLILIASVLLLASCQKCYDATVTVTTKTTGQHPTTGTTVTKLCGDDSNYCGETMVTTATVNGFTTTITTKYVCH